MSVISQPEFVVNSVNTDFQESINKLKSGRKGYIGNLTKCINGVTLLTDNMSNYDEVYLLCKKNQIYSF